MCAASLSNHSVVVLEKNAKAAEKIRVSGGGKCNITNTTLDPSFYLGDPDFIQPALEFFDNHRLLAWLEKRGLLPRLSERVAPGQLFCQNSQEPIDLLLRAAAHADIRFNTEVRSVAYRQGVYAIQTNREAFSARALVVASGGVSYPQLGVSGIGYAIAEQFGHETHTTRPALVGMSVQKEQFWFKQLSGVALPVVIEVADQRLSGNLLFTHKGCSGPAVMNASLYWERGAVTIDFLPKIAWRNLDRKTMKQFSSLLPLPKRFVREFLQAVGLLDQPCRHYSDAEWSQLASLKQYRFAPAGVLGYAKAEVSKGGVSTQAVDPKMMQSCHQPGLYFIGEVLDVTGQLGGYNLQWAFSSARLCAAALADNGIMSQVKEEE